MTCISGYTRFLSFTQAETLLAVSRTTANSNPPHTTTNLSKRRWPLRNEQLLANALGNTVRKREFEVLGEELSDVWSFDIRRLLDLHDFQDLNGR